MPLSSRCFEDPTFIMWLVIDPVSDIEITTELVPADLMQSKRHDKGERRARR
jgi:hypothetical protein